MFRRRLLKAVLPLIGIGMLLMCASAYSDEESDATSLYLRGEKAFNKGEYAVAIECWQKVLKLKPTSEYTKKMLGIAIKKNDADKFYREGKKAYDTFNYKVAVEKLEKAQALQPSDPKITDLLDWSRKAWRAEQEKARQRLEEDRAAGLAPPEPPPPQSDAARGGIAPTVEQLKEGLQKAAARDLEKSQRLKAFKIVQVDVLLTDDAENLPESYDRRGSVKIADRNREAWLIYFHKRGGGPGAWETHDQL